VFISSTSGALDPYRSAAIEVCHRLHLDPVAMEDFDPQRPPPVEVCRQRVESCELFVLLLGHRRGDRPPGSEQSYVELEYGWARAQPRTKLLIFVVDPDHPWPPRDMATGADAEALAEFRDRICRAHTVRSFTTVAGFREDLMVALHRESEGDDGRTEDHPSTPGPPAFFASPPYVGNAPFTGRTDDLRTLDNWGRSSDPVMVVEAIGGTGKSALTWHWVERRAPQVVTGLAGRFWWSFYDGSASILRFMHHLLAYLTARPVAEVSDLERTELIDAVTDELTAQPFLVVLDGFERMLTAYHRFDPSKLMDDRVEVSKRSLIDTYADEVIRRLIAARPTKVLVNSRLLPEVLQSRFGPNLPGVAHLRLPGLTDADTRTLLARLGVTCSDRASRGFFQPLGNHPLLVGIVAGLVTDYRPDPGNFDRWLADPTAGGALALPELGLVQRRNHILAAALDDLPEGDRRLLGWISVLAGSVDWATLDAINPFRPDPPRPREADLSVLGPRPGPPNPFDYRPPSY
jgi:hypothetical protein